MYALILDDGNLSQPRKEVVSVHRSRETAEKALAKRMKTLGKRVWECDTRIVWVKTKTRAGEFLQTADFETWRPGEEIPLGERFPDSD